MSAAGTVAKGRFGGVSETAARPLRVLLADPAPMHRSGLRMVLAPRSGPAAQPGLAHGAAARDDGARGAAARNDGAHGASARDDGAHGASARDDGAHGAAAPDDGARGPVAEIVVVGETGDGAEAVELARRLLPDVLICEIALPRLDGHAVARAVTGAGLPVRVLILTDHDSDEHVLAAIAAGAAGFLRKDAPAAEVITAVRAVATGGAVITPPVLARILVRVAEALPAPETTVTSKLDTLTEREREVLVHVARGHSNSEIAMALQVSETTIKTHVGHVLTKLRLRDRTQAVVLAYETGLVKPGT
ncbi:response regulator transcription factor [Actinoplanes sp. NPDC026619]|uniref:response regulator transcription factor n=1 Tax=Actinoplanes sp. NPDC026619 TaxID=3155798 RepID=UPI0033D7C57E